MEPIQPRLHSEAVELLAAGVQLQGQGADNYLWSPVTFLSDPNIANPWAKPNTNTQYILTGTLNNGCTKNDTLQIDVNPLPNLSTGGDNNL